MEYYRETALRRLERLVLFSIVVVGFFASEVANSKENNATLIVGKACSLRPGKSPNQYEEVVIGIGWISRKCAPGSEFKLKDCRCLVSSLKDAFGKKNSSINLAEEDSSELQNQSLSSSKNSFKYNEEQHSTPSKRGSLPEKVFTDKEKSKIVVDFGSTTGQSADSDDDKLTELLAEPHMTSTTPTAASVTDTTLRDEMVSEAMHLFSEYFRQEILKVPPISKAEQSIDRTQAETSTLKMKDFDVNNIITDNMKLSLSEWADLLSSIDQKSNADSKNKNIKISTSQTLFTTVNPSLATKSQTPEQSSPWKESGQTKQDKKTSTTNVTLEVLEKNKTEQSHKDSKWRTMATTRQHPNVVLDYSSVTISEPFGAFDLSKDIPLYLPAEMWLKSRLPVIETERRRRNRANNPLSSRDDLSRPGNWLSHQFITSTNRKPKLRERAAEAEPTTIKMRNEHLSSENFKVSSPETQEREDSGISRRPNPTNVPESRKRERKESLSESVALKDKPSDKLVWNLVFPAYEFFQNTRSSSKDLKMDFNKIDLKGFMNKLKEEKENSLTYHHFRSFLNNTSHRFKKSNKVSANRYKILPTSKISQHERKPFFFRSETKILKAQRVKSNQSNGGIDVIKLRRISGNSKRFKLSNMKSAVQKVNPLNNDGHLLPTFFKKIPPTNQGNMLEKIILQKKNSFPVNDMKSFRKRGFLYRAFVSQNNDKITANPNRSSIDFGTK